MAGTGGEEGGRVCVCACVCVHSFMRCTHHWPLQLYLRHPESWHMPPLWAECFFLPSCSVVLWHTHFLCCGMHIPCVVACTFLAHFLHISCTFLVLWHAHFLHISCVVACTFLDVACTFLVLWRAHFFSPIMQRCVVACTFRSPVQACTSLFCLHHPVVHVMITPLGSKSVIFVSITHCCGLPHEEQNAFFGSMTALWYAP